MKNWIILAFIIGLAGVGWTSCGEVSDDKNKNSKSQYNQKELDKFLVIGNQYADSAQKVLGENLKRALADGGPVGALEFCNVRALQLTDSSAKAMNVELKRVSDKARNPLNTADVEELEIIGAMKSELKAKGKITPHIFQANREVLAYYPILTKPMCLQCHGTPDKDIDPETLAVINQIYLADKATGYSANEVRGMWKVILDSDLD